MPRTHVVFHDGNRPAARADAASSLARWFDAACTRLASVCRWHHRDITTLLRRTRIAGRRWCRLREKARRTEL